MFRTVWTEMNSNCTERNLSVTGVWKAFCVFEEIHRRRLKLFELSALLSLSLMAALLLTIKP